MPVPNRRSDKIWQWLSGVILCFFFHILIVLYEFAFFIFHINIVICEIELVYAG